MDDAKKFVDSVLGGSDAIKRERDALERGAKELGIDPVDYATAISYESAGTFNPWVAGPTTKWGQHRGTIQYGEPQRRQYGVHKGQSFEDQVTRSNVQYLRDAGVKPGMTFEQIYAAINGGSASRNLDTPEYMIRNGQRVPTGRTIRDNINKAMRDHRSKVLRRYGWASPEAEFINNVLGQGGGTSDRDAAKRFIDDVLGGGQMQAEGGVSPTSPSPTFPTGGQQVGQGAVRPFPETDDTINAQIAATVDMNSPRQAVLLTEPQQEALARNYAQLFHRVELPEGILLVSKTKTAGIPDIEGYVRQNGFAALIGKVETAADTTSGQTLVTTDPQGRELASSVVSGPEAADRQAELDRQSFPQATDQRLMTTADAVKEREHQAIGAEYQAWLQENNYQDNKWSVDAFNTERRAEQERLAGEEMRGQPGYEDYAAFAAERGLDETSPDTIEAYNKSIQDRAATQKEQGRGQAGTIRKGQAGSGRLAQEQQAAGAVTRPRGVGRARGDLNTVHTEFQASRTMSAEEGIRSALAATGQVTPAQIDAFIAARKKDGIPLLRPQAKQIKPGESIQVSYEIIREATGRSAKEATADMQLEESLSVFTPNTVDRGKAFRLPEAEAKKALTDRIREKSYAFRQIMSEILGSTGLVGAYFGSQEDVERQKALLGGLLKGSPEVSDQWVEAELARLKDQHGSLTQAWDAENYYQNTGVIENVVRGANQTARSFLKNLIGGTGQTLAYASQMYEAYEPINQLLPDEYKIGLRNAGNLLDFTTRFLTSGSWDTAVKDVEWIKSTDDISRNHLFRAFREFQETIGDDPVLKGRLLGEASEGLGSGLAFIVMGMAMPSLGVLGRSPRFPLVNLQTGLAGTLQMAGPGYEEAKESGVTEEQARAFGVISAMLGLTEMLGAGSELSRIVRSKDLRKQLISAFLDVKQGLRTATREAKQEFAQELFQTVAGEGILDAMKDDAEGLERLTNALNALPQRVAEGAAHEGLMGALIGFTLGGGGHIARRVAGDTFTAADISPLNESELLDLVRGREVSPQDVAAARRETEIRRPIGDTDVRQPQQRTTRAVEEGETLAQGDTVMVRGNPATVLEDIGGMVRVETQLPNGKTRTKWEPKSDMVIATEAETDQQQQPQQVEQTGEPSLDVKAERESAVIRPRRYYTEVVQGLDVEPLPGPQRVEAEAETEQPTKTKRALTVARQAQERAGRERRRADEAETLANTDPKTGLSSKIAWNIARPRIEADPEQEVISLDINRMKEANDTTSHTFVDDQILAPLGEAVKKVLDRHGVPVRNAFAPGGDEAIVAVPKGLAQQIRDDIEKEFGTVEIIAQKDFTNDRTGESFKKGDVIPVTISGETGLTVAEAEANLGERKRASKEASPIRRERVSATQPPQKPTDMGGVSLDTPGVRDGIADGSIEDITGKSEKLPARYGHPNDSVAAAKAAKESLVNVRKDKADAYKIVKRLRDKLTNATARDNKAAIRVDLLQAEAQWKEYVRLEQSTIADVKALEAEAKQDKPLQQAAVPFDAASLYNKDGSVNHEQVKDVAGRVESGSLTIERLDPEAERGRIAGGKRAIEASVLLGADAIRDQKASQRGRANVESRGDRRRRQEKLLENYAKRESIWYDWSKFFQGKRPIGRGGEAFVYRQDDNTVVKTVDYHHIDKGLTPQEFLDNRISLYNHLFPETAYKLIGFTKDSSGRFRFIVTQPFIDVHGVSQADVEQAMSVAGFEKIGRESYGNTLYQVHDVHQNNAAKDASGNIFVIDAVPKPVYEVEGLEIEPSQDAGGPLQQAAVTDAEWEAEVRRQMADVKEVRDDQGRLLAPNGKVSKLNEHQWKQVRTPAFQRFFGDWQNDPENASQVVDPETGEPMVMWHGSRNAGFLQFDEGRIGSNSDAQGIHFTNQKSVAATYSGTRDEYVPPTHWRDAGLTIEFNENYGEFAVHDPDGYELQYAETEQEAERVAQELIDSGEYQPEESGNYAGFVNLRRPVMDVDVDGGSWSDRIFWNQSKARYITVSDDSFLDWEFNHDDGTYVNDAGDVLYEEAYDINDLVRTAKDMEDAGVIVRNVYDDGGAMGTQYIGGDSTQAIIFDSRNFKSLHNRGTFDPQDPNILHKKIDPESDEALTRDWPKAHPYEVLRAAEWKVDANGDIEMNEGGYELLRRLQGAVFGRTDPSYGSTFTQGHIRKLARKALERARAFEKAGYANAEKLRALAKDLQKAAEQTAVIAYVFDEALPEETHHKMVLELLGGKKLKAAFYRALEGFDVWNSDPDVTTLGRTRQFSRLYPGLNDAARRFEKALELAAKLETGQIKHKDKDKFLKAFAEGMREHLGDRIKEIDPDKYRRILDYAETQSDQGQGRTGEVADARERSDGAVEAAESGRESADQERAGRGAAAAAPETATGDRGGDVQTERKKGVSLHWEKVKADFEAAYASEEEFDTITHKEQARLALEFIQKNRPQAMRVVYKLEDPPDGLKRVSVGIVLSNALFEAGKHEQAEMVARLTSQMLSDVAQELGLGNLDFGSPRRLFQAVTSARLANLGKTIKMKDKSDLAKGRAKVKDGAQAAAREVNATAKNIEAADKLLEMLLCR